MKNLSSELNKINSVNLKISSWRIIIGPWLHSFLVSAYDKFKNLNHLVKNKKKYKLETEVIDFKLNEIVPKNYLDFVLNF